MTTPSLASVCCGVRAGLGVTIRTTLGFSKGLARGLSIVPPGRGLPPLPPIDIVLYRVAEPSSAVQTFSDQLVATLRRECLTDTSHAAQPAKTALFAGVQQGDVRAKRRRRLCAN